MRAWQQTPAQQRPHELLHGARASGLFRWILAPACWECTVATDVAAAVTSAWFFASLMTRRSLRHHPVFLASRIHISGAA